MAPCFGCNLDLTSNQNFINLNYLHYGFLLLLKMIIRKLVYLLFYLDEFLVDKQIKTYIFIIILIYLFTFANLIQLPSQVLTKFKND